MSLLLIHGLYVASNKVRMGNQISILRALDELTLYLNENKLAVNRSKMQLSEIMIAQKRAKVDRKHPTIRIEKEPG